MADLAVRLHQVALLLLHVLQLLNQVELPFVDLVDQAYDLVLVADFDPDVFVVLLTQSANVLQGFHFLF